MLAQMAMVNFIIVPIKVRVKVEKQKLQKDTFEVKL